MPEAPYERMVIKKIYEMPGLNDVPIVMAIGVWHLSEWNDWIDNPELGIVFNLEPDHY